MPINQQFGNVSLGALTVDTQDVTGAGATTNVSPSVGVVLVDTATAGETLVLSNNANPGQTVTIVQTVGANNTVVSEATGTTILGATVSLTHDAVGEWSTLVFISVTLGWAVVGTSATVA
ncbi:hypothetical protein SAGO17_0068 [Mimivirus AB-566-O17]|uniref:Uncharacterized protein n=1 Tax=Mimivirus AB-566-O17 TaxID=1988039 RepID=A0A1X9VNU4_9VIRU|nr:hypothetical protein SAGO17_0068 [Mimivirus AB-566-O17]